MCTGKCVENKILFVSRTPSTRRTNQSVACILRNTPLFVVGNGRVIPDEQRLLRKMFRTYDNSVRPVYNATSNVVVNFGLTLIQIMDMVSI